MQKINLLCPTFRKKNRKIGRNEACPCGRTKEKRVVVTGEQVYKYIGLDDKVGTVVKVPMKYKHCCGDTDNQKAIRAVGRHVGNFVNNLFTVRAEKKSLLKKLKGFFTNKIHNGKHWIK